MTGASSESAAGPRGRDLQPARTLPGRNNLAMALAALAATGLAAGCASQPSSSLKATYEAIATDQDAVMGSASHVKAPSWFGAAKLVAVKTQPFGQPNLPDGSLTVRMTHRRASLAEMRAGAELALQSYPYDETGMHDMGDRVAAHVRSHPGAIVAIDWVDAAKRYQVAMTVRTLNALNIKPAFASWYNWPNGWVVMPG